MRLHLFYPENDLALARNITHYTAPTAAVRLRTTGYALPIWYGEPGDSFISNGINASWFDTINHLFNPGIRPFDHNPEGLTAAPWGWSRASRQVYADIGFKQSELPDDQRLDAIRMLSHRRTAAKASAMLADRLPFTIAPASVELTTEASIAEFVAAHHEGSVIKLPWSSSGRGLTATDNKVFASQAGIFRGMLNRQGSVMAEPRYTKLLDFAMLFTMNEGRCTFNGLSLFHNIQLGSYSGNDLAPQDVLEKRITDIVGTETFNAVKNTLPGVLEEIAGDSYDGPLGVDMMAVDNPAYTIVPVVEINFRMTMGHLCRRFYERFAVPGVTGSFSVRPVLRDPSGKISVSVFNGRISNGTLDLAPPCSYFSFLINIG